jgi:hypothetical protein
MNQSSFTTRTENGIVISYADNTIGINKPSGVTGSSDDFIDILQSIYEYDNDLMGMSPSITANTLKSNIDYYLSIYERKQVNFKFTID